MSRGHDSIAYAPRGLSRDEAARYVGVGATKFDELVAARRMPKPKRIDGRTVWDRIALDAAFTDLPEDGGNKIDQLFARRSA
jgi:predicted DNA-binding transcriptional regulator AlpA